MHTLAHYLSALNTTKGRHRKQFNPLLGETYELVTEDFRFISEQVCHHPPISAYIQEGKGYTNIGFLKIKSSFGFGSGTGAFYIQQIGYKDYYFHDTKHTISINAPDIHVTNIVFGQTYADFDGEIEAMNHQTGERALVKF